MILTIIIMMSTTRILTLVYNKEYCVYTYTLYTFLQWTCVNKAHNIIWDLCEDWACSQKQHFNHRSRFQAFFTQLTC